MKKIIKSILLGVFLLVVGVPSVLYIVLSTSWAQNLIREAAEAQLGKTLGTEVEIAKVDYHPFNSATVEGVTVRDHTGGTAMSVARVTARFELFHFITSGQLLFDYAVVDAPYVNLWRDTPDSPLNIQPILDHLARKDDDKPPTPFDLKIGTVVVRDGIFDYNVRSEGETPDRFNKSHIGVSGFNLHAYLRQATNEKADVLVESMSFGEKSGFRLTDFVADVSASGDSVDMRRLYVELPESRFALAPISVSFGDGKDMLSALSRNHIELLTEGPAIISTADLSAFSPVLGNLDLRAVATFDIELCDSVLELRQFDVSAGDITARMSGRVEGSLASDDIFVELDIRGIDAGVPAIATLAGRLGRQLPPWLNRMEHLSADGYVKATKKRIDADITVGADRSVIRARGTAQSDDLFKNMDFEGDVSVDNFPLGMLTRDSRVGNVTASLSGRGRLNNRKISADGHASVQSAEWNGHTYTGIDVEGSYSDRAADLRVSSADPAASFTLDASLGSQGRERHLAMRLDVSTFKPEELNIPFGRKGFTLRGVAEADLRGTSVNDIAGSVVVSDVVVADTVGTLELKKFSAVLERGAIQDVMTVESDYLNGKIEGVINPTGLPPLFRDIASRICPALYPPDPRTSARLAEDGFRNRFVGDFILSDVEPVSDFLRLPMRIIYPVDIAASVNSESGAVSVSVDIPYIQQGDKIIDSTVFRAYADSESDRLLVYATTHMPTKKGPMAVVLGITGSDNRFDTNIEWEIERAIPINGIIDFSTALSRSEGGGVCVASHFNPGRINFGEDIWDIVPSDVTWCDNALTVDGFRLDSGDQSIRIDGRGSASDDDVLSVRLKDIRLLSIFETLEIDRALIGGTADGSIKARRLLSGHPVITSDYLHVDSISYNRCVLGTGEAKALWDNQKQSVRLEAEITNPEGQKSYVYGDIFPMSESLDLSFDATDVRVGFMQPFMSVFASDITGYASGHARIFGTFKHIDMEGDVYARDLSLRIDFTNTVYSATDSIHIRPGVIELDNVTIRDVNGHTAKLSGILTHEFFHFPRFDFRITDARDFLCYNVTEAMSPDWYGTIYGNGTGSVTGWPGVVNIGARMSTAPGSVFSFVLSDRLDAEQYSFITFNDVTDVEGRKELREVDDTPEAVKEYMRRINAAKYDPPSDYNLDFRVDITPDAEMIIVMDPIGGDRIRAYGNGDMRMTYNSTENDLRMYGTYTLDRGSYNFTLQDIIIKDFTIDPGSSITFRGDPYSAQLDLEAVYQLNANLSDLDKSFTMDKDLNRTNVPVQALLIVRGDMRQPDVSFDLRFPTLTSDTYRKVRSIISTDDMMSRQIIYLLALNRFYTPDYMDSTRGSELFSVASSTIASRLSSMLGKLSDKWSIAPNLRSDRGDFRDVEVDVTLSSRLLNNRLLLNGNLGYRDKSLNTNQFIGDFDIEYLLTPGGNWRLKGYSRYNDQNYYVRTAPTTQGVGIMFRLDFDTLFPRRKKK